MSRSEYSDNPQHLDLWRGAVQRAATGKRGQKLLRDMLEALDAMPERRLLCGVLECQDGVCAMGAVGRSRGVDMRWLPSDRHTLAEAFDVAPALAAEVMYLNDERFEDASPEQRWISMRAWVASQITEPQP